MRNKFLSSIPMSPWIYRSKRSENVATRAIIFSQYRDSVQEITACLHAYKPLVKVMEFVGQAGLKGTYLVVIPEKSSFGKVFTLTTVAALSSSI